MGTLTEFLRARIAEDEEMARRCKDGNGWSPGSGGIFWTERPRGPIQIEPRRLLAECAAKRDIVDRLSPYFGDPTNDVVLIEAVEDALVALAQPFADHPEFREEWRASPVTTAGGVNDGQVSEASPAVSEATPDESKGAVANAPAPPAASHVPGCNDRCEGDTHFLLDEDGLR